MINHVILVGRITKDPELRKTQSGLSTVSFTVACNRRFTSQGQELQADFINCVAWRQTADYMANYVKKGALLGVEGRMQTRNYADKSGHKVYVTEVVCDSVQTLARSSSEAQRATQPTYQAAPVNSHTQNSPLNYNDEFTEVNLDIAMDDLPF